MPTPASCLRAFTFGFTLTSALAGAASPASPPAPKPQPVRSITVKLMSAGSVAEPWKISTLTDRTCTAQVDEPQNMAPAFAACLAAKPEARGCRALTMEDESKARGRVLPDGTWTKEGCKAAVN